MTELSNDEIEWLRAFVAPPKWFGKEPGQEINPTTMSLRDKGMIYITGGADWTSVNLTDRGRAEAIRLGLTS